MISRFSFIAVACVASIASGQLDRPAKITRVEFSPQVERIGHGDNWHFTWAADDNQYTCWGDGRGFGSSMNPTMNNGVAVVTGGPMNPGTTNLTSYPFVAESVQHWYSYGLLSIEDTLFMFVSFLEHGADRVAGSKQPTRFVGTRLVWSTDQGKSWKTGSGHPLKWDPPSAENMTFWKEPNDTFSLISVLQQGRAYRRNQDGYVYLYAPNGSDERMRELVLARVPRGELRNRSAYEFFVARDDVGKAMWTADIGRRRPVHEFRESWVASTLAYSWHPFVIYDEPLKLYLMVASGNGRSGSVTFSKPSGLGVYSAPQPWGPWTEVYWNDSWTGDDLNNRLYEPVLPPKWVSPDGKSMYLGYSDCRDGYTRNYKLNLQKLTLSVE